MILMFIGIGIGSESADMKKVLSEIYQIGRFEKGDLSVLIGIGRYEKKLIGRTLLCTTLNNSCATHAQLVRKALNWTENLYLRSLMACQSQLP